MKTDFVVALTLATFGHSLFLFGFNEPASPQLLTPEASLVCELKAIPAAIPIIEYQEIVDLQTDRSKQSDATNTKDKTKLPSEPSRSSPVSQIRLASDPPDLRIEVEGTLGAISGGNLASEWGGRGGVIGVAGLDRVPAATTQIAPQFPYELRRKRVSGRAWVRFVVGTDGRVRSAEAIQASHSEFGRAAIAAVNRWRFEPGRRHGKAVEFRMTVPVHFSIQDS